MGVSALKKALSILLAAGLLLARIPAAAASAHVWQLRTSRLFFADFPGLGLAGFRELPQATVLALARALDRSGVDPAAIAALSPEQQLEKVRSILRSGAASLQEEGLPRSEGSSPSERLQSLALRRAALRDLRASTVFLEAREGKGVLRDLAVAEARVERRFREESSRLIEGRLARILDTGDASWRGRTADIKLEDGSVVSFKRHSDMGSLRNESAKMQEVLSYGIDAPIPLSRANGQFGLKPSGKAERYLPYLLPKGLVDGYRGYLNDKLPAGLSREQKISRLEGSALRAVEHMLLLLKNNRAHASLMPLSHHGDHWEWDFWRWNTPFLGGMRYGPSFINDWRKAFTYPNLRHSGLADWEHIEPFEYFHQTHTHADHAHGTVSHDAYSLALGQNLAELSFILLHSGAVNGLSSDDTARIIATALRAYLAGVLPAGAAAKFSEREALAAARASSRSFSLARRFWEPGVLLIGGMILTGLGLSVSIPILSALIPVAVAVPLILLVAGVVLDLGNLFLGGIISLVSTCVIVSLYLSPWLITLVSGASALVALCRTDGVLHIPRNMPGSVVHELLMRAVKPAVELLRDNAEFIGLPALSHPSGSAWDFRQAALFAFALCLALIIPTAGAALLGFFGLQMAAALGFMAHPMVLPAIAGFAFALAATRVLYFLFSLARRIVTHFDSPWDWVYTLVGASTLRRGLGRRSSPPGRAVHAGRRRRQRSPGRRSQDVGLGRGV